MKDKSIKYYVIIWDINKDDIESYDIFPYLGDCWDEDKKRKHKIWSQSDKMPETFNEYKQFILKASRYQFWSRCEYEIIISDWPCQKHEKKIDVYTQIEGNIDAITKLFMQYINKNK